MAHFTELVRKRFDGFFKPSDNRKVSIRHHENSQLRTHDSMTTSFPSASGWTAALNGSRISILGAFLCQFPDHAMRTCLSSAVTHTLTDPNSVNTGPKKSRLLSSSQYGEIPEQSNKVSFSSRTKQFRIMSSHSAAAHTCWPSPIHPPWV